MTLNLVFVVSDQEGRVTWNKGPALNPYVFEANFFISRLYNINESDVPNYLILNELISKEVENERFEILRSPLLQIELKKMGFEEPWWSTFERNCYEDPASKKLGYLYWAIADDIKNLEKAGIEYMILKKEEQIEYKEEGKSSLVERILNYFK